MVMMITEKYVYIYISRLVYSRYEPDYWMLSH